MERKESLTIAPLRNVALCSKALERAINRPAHLPGIIEMHGHAGIGKSFAAGFAANTFGAYYIQCQSSWTRKATLLAITKEMGIRPAVTIYDLADQVSEHLALSGRALIVDEVDHLIRRNAIEIIRDIYEGSQAAILIIGEEMLPTELKRWERFDSRVLDFVAAQPADATDAAILAKFYSRAIGIKEDLLAETAARSKGSVRRICVNLARIEEETLERGAKDVDLPLWVKWGKGFFTGDVAVRPR